MQKANRLRSRHDFRAVFREGIRLQGTHLTLRALRSKLAPGDHAKSTVVLQTRIGISISTKVSKRAVTRNRIKRQIRAACRSLLPKLLPGWRLVIIVQPSAVKECDYHQFLQELEQLLVEAEVLNGYS